MTSRLQDERRSVAARLEFGRISVIFGAKNGKYPDGNQVVVRGSVATAVLDTSLVANSLGPEFTGADLVVMSHVHEDHMAGLHRLPHADVYVHKADVEAARSWEGMMRAFGFHGVPQDELLARFQRDFFYKPRPGTLPYDDEAVWDLGGVRIRALHMPGHTAGHSVLLLEPQGIAFIGDIDLSSFGPYYGDASSSLSDFRATLARLPGIPAKTWITFHHRGVYTDRGRFLDDLTKYRSILDRREQRLLELLKRSPKTLAELTDCRLLYPPHIREPWVGDVEARTISQHLTELLAAGRVHKTEDLYSIDH